ncbi:MAG: hypothetical protein V4628_10405 [Pseudomonadota bacterium]
MTNTLRLYRATVSSTDDPEGLGRVRLTINRNVKRSPVEVDGWANVAASPLGASAEIRPRYTVGDNVLYAAERLPFVGAVVLCRETTSAASVGVNNFSLQLGQGNEMKIEAAEGTLRLSTTAGQQITLHANGTIEASSTQILLNASKLTVAASLVSIESGMVQCSGVLKCDTLIANSVIGASYTPGAGNIW